MRKTVVGSIVGVLTAAGLGAAMLPGRAHLSVATAALVLVVPVVVAVVVGGLGAGVITVMAGFFVYDFVFIPPYYSLRVRTAQNWAALGVYVVLAALTWFYLRNHYPVSTYWPMQLFEAGWLLALSAALVAGTLRLVRRYAA